MEIEKHGSNVNMISFQFSWQARCAGAWWPVSPSLHPSTTGSTGTGCSLNRYCVFFQEFSKVCHLSLASTLLLLVVQKITIDRLEGLLQRCRRGRVCSELWKNTIFPEHPVHCYRLKLQQTDKREGRRLDIQSYPSSLNFKLFMPTVPTFSSSSCSFFL